MKPARSGAPDMLTARLPGNMVSHVWIPDDGQRQALCISSELGTITITPLLLFEYLSLSCLERAVAL